MAMTTTSKQVSRKAFGPIHLVWPAAPKLACLVLVLSVLRSTIGKFIPSVCKRLLCGLLGLPSPLSGAIRRLGTFQVPGGSPDVQLSTFAYVREDRRGPTLLMRTPYGKHLLELVSYAFAAQGFNVVVQDCRGRFASTGNQLFGAFEDQDGVATLDWLEEQGFAWYDPARVVMFGISYLGIAQWAAVAGLARQKRAISGDAKENNADDAQGTKITSRMAAIAPLFSATSAHSAMFHGDAFRMDFSIRYLHLLVKMNSLLSQAVMPFILALFEFRLHYYVRRCLGRRSLLEALGLPDIFKYNPRPQSRFWQNRDYSDALPHSPPAFIASGWHDFFLESSLSDYEQMVRCHGPGHARLLIGPWTHLGSVGLPAFRVLASEGLRFLKERTGLLPPCVDTRNPVRLWIMGSRASEGSWREFTTWPPEEVDDELLYLGPGTLGSKVQSDSQSGHKKRFIDYQPYDPTPSLGGSQLWGHQSGEMDQQQLVTREDVLLFDSMPLEASIVVVGRARLRLAVSASQPNFDIFARLCDVHPNGRCYNVCDAIFRYQKPMERSHSHQEMHLEHQNEAEPIVLELTFAATAKRFRTGHRIRLIVSGGAFPQWARNFGDSEQAVDDEPLEVNSCQIEVLHSDKTPSSLWLPALSGHSGSASPRRRSLVKAAAERLTPASPSRRRKKSCDLIDFGDILRRIQSEMVLKR